MADEPTERIPRDRLLAIVCVLAIIVCIFMAFLELSRAMAGDSGRAWFYTLEWPAFAVVIIWIWRRLDRRFAEERLARERPFTERPLPREPGDPPPETAA